MYVRCSPLPGNLQPNHILRRVDATKWEVLSFVDPGYGLMLKIWKCKLRAELAWPVEGEEPCCWGREEGELGSPLGVVIRTGKKV